MWKHKTINPYMICLLILRGSMNTDTDFSLRIFSASYAHVENTFDKPFLYLKLLYILMNCSSSFHVLHFFPHLHVCMNIQKLVYCTVILFGLYTGLLDNATAHPVLLGYIP
jgi:hypothetical protein